MTLKSRESWIWTFVFDSCYPIDALFAFSLEFCLSQPTGRHAQKVEKMFKASLVTMLEVSILYNIHTHVLSITMKVASLHRREVQEVHTPCKHVIEDLAIVVPSDAHTHNVSCVCQELDEVARLEVGWEVGLMPDGWTTQLEVPGQNCTMVELISNLSVSCMHVT